MENFQFFFVANDEAVSEEAAMFSCESNIVAD